MSRAKVIGVLAALGLVDAAAISLFQLGVLRHLPDPPGFDSDAVAGSRVAHPFGVPDGPLAALYLAGMLALAGAARRRSGRGRKEFDVLLGLGGLAGGVGAMVDTWKSVVRLRRACAWCLPLTAINLVLAGATIPPALRALRG